MLSLSQNEASKDHHLGKTDTPDPFSTLALTRTPGLSLREMIHEFKYQTLVLFKALLLQPKVCCVRGLNLHLCLVAQLD